MQGKVKWFNTQKGFGFITPDGGGKDLFAHYSEIREDGYKNLVQEQRVEFELKEEPRGPKAINIRKAA